jgi:tRNA pseudouridine55 synthase
MGRRDKGNKVDGWLVFDKPVGMTSTEAVSRVKRLLNASKAGHAGTLDPLASGSLPIALGEATKTVSLVMDGRKLYRFTINWGAETTTDDLEGPVAASSDIRPSEAEIRAILPEFTGVITQVPPKYSAIKFAGERAYDRVKSRSTGSISSPAPTRTTRSSSPNAARALTSAPWRAIWAGGSVRTAMLWRSGGWRLGRSPRTA